MEIADLVIIILTLILTASSVLCVTAIYTDCQDRKEIIRRIKGTRKTVKVISKETE